MTKQEIRSMAQTVRMAVSYKIREHYRKHNQCRAMQNRAEAEKMNDALLDEWLSFSHEEKMQCCLFEASEKLLDAASFVPFELEIES